MYFLKLEFVLKLLMNNELFQAKELLAYHQN